MSKKKKLKKSKEQRRREFLRGAEVDAQAALAKAFDRMVEKVEAAERGLTLERLVYHGRTTVAFWSDGTRTTVRCAEGDEFSKEAGLVYATVKKVSGNTTNYKEAIRRAVASAEVYEDRREANVEGAEARNEVAPV